MLVFFNHQIGLIPGSSTTVFKKVSYISILKRSYPGGSKLPKINPKNIPEKEISQSSSNIQNTSNTQVRLSVAEIMQPFDTNISSDISKYTDNFSKSTQTSSTQNISKPFMNISEQVNQSNLKPGLHTPSTWFSKNKEDDSFNKNPNTTSTSQVQPTSRLPLTNQSSTKTILEKPIDSKQPHRNYPGKGYTATDHKKTINSSGKQESDVRLPSNKKPPLHETSHTSIVDNEDSKEIGILSSCKNPQKGFKKIANENYKGQSVGSSNLDPNKPKPQYMKTYENPRMHERNYSYK
jgi:hypothetical protein